MSQQDSRGERGSRGRGRGRGRGGGGGQDRRQERDGARGGDSRARSRSPRRDRDRDRNSNIRTRSPPRGPRRDHDISESNSRRPPTNPTKPQLARGIARDSSSKPPPASAASGLTSTNGVVLEMEVDKNGAEPKVAGEDGEEDEDPEVRAMKKVMGFGKFKSTKNTKVPGNDRNYAVRKEKKTEYRQYMNRSGGFNRPLSPG